ncbi:lysylphosphatidylglycerol synthase transmembrane domain-containing protein [Oceaniglobus indicus]|uniref:lysylphosphatidylglycerol synthase transmembrane domain-containing protein n=1 Tax=Oceaniglobus indicus TaxID=2047749 RepID=UPI000C19143A|nr:lysylphosphatidylglycerol synthase transmembrane domain-containing protein [Oceaniglobus indicus]
MKRGVAIVLRLGVSVAMLAAVLVLTDGAAALARLADADIVWLIAAGALLSVQTVLMAARWRLTAGRLGLHIGWDVAIGEYYLAQLVNMTLPGGVVGDVARTARSRHDAGLAPAIHAVMIERLAGQIAMFTVLLAGLCGAMLVPSGITVPSVFATVALTGLATVAAGLIAMAVWPRWRPDGVTADFAVSLRRALFARDVAWKQVLLALAIVALNLAAFAAAARATGTVLGFAACVILIPLILTAMTIPFAVGGWGWREGAAAALFPLADATGEAGVAAGLAFGLVMLIASVPGALWPMVGVSALPPVRSRPS